MRMKLESLMKLIIVSFIFFLFSCGSNNSNNDTITSSESGETEDELLNKEETEISVLSSKYDYQTDDMTSSGLNLNLLVSDYSKSTSATGLFLNNDKNNSRNDEKSKTNLSSKDVVSISLDVKRLAFVDSAGKEEYADINQI